MKVLCGLAVRLGAGPCCTSGSPGLLAYPCLEDRCPGSDFSPLAASSTMTRGRVGKGGISVWCRGRIEQRSAGSSAGQGTSSWPLLGQVLVAK